MSDVPMVLARLTAVVALALPCFAIRARGQEGPTANRSAPASHPDANAVKKSEQFPLAVEIRQSVLSDTNPRSGGARYFAALLRFTNQSNRDLSLPMTQVRLSVNGDEYVPTVRPPALESYFLQTGVETIPFRDLPQLARLDLPAGATESTWLIYTKLPRSMDVPALTLDVLVDGRQHALDLNDVHRERLQLSVERIGPKGVLGLLRVGGVMDTVNVGVFVEELRRLANQGIVRVVVEMTEPPDQLPKSIRRWLNQTVDPEPTSRLLTSLPTVPNTIREFHIAVPSGRVAFSRHVYHGRPHVHETAAAAVEWALEPVLKYLPAEEVVRQIEQGHPLVRAAALAAGASQLSADHLPLILRLAEDDDPLIRRGALLSLRDFAEPAAVEALVAQAKRSSTATATLAVECLAASRYPQAHVQLERLLSGRLNVPPVDLVQILARYPRVQWIDSLARLASGSWGEGEAGDAELIDVRRDALIALGRIGHPDLIDLLSEALDSGEQSLRSAAFGLLESRTDQQSERLAVDYALEVTRSEFPSQQILKLFERVRDPRAVPILVTHLRDAGHDRRQLIQTLAVIGDGSIDQTLLEHYDDLQPNEQQVLVSSLTELESPHAFALAAEGLQRKNSRVARQSVGALQQIGSPEAVAVLADALLATSNATSVSYLSRALADIGTNDALNGMRRAMYAGDQPKKRRIARKLVYHQQRSPGFQPLETATDHVRNEQWKQAEKAYLLAIKLDPELSDAYSGRGHCRLQLERFDEAADDYRLALRNNPFDYMAVTGLALVHTRTGEVDRGVRMVEEAAARFPNDDLFAYNSACVYGRAIDITLQRPLSEVRPVRVARLQEKAMAQLRRAVELGFDEFDFMRRDPDLASLRDLKEFQQLGTSSSADANE